MRNIPLLFLTLILACGCSRRPKNIIDENKMVEIMADIRIAEAYDRYGDSYGRAHTGERELLGRGVLKQHGVSPEEMDSTLAWYGRNMDEYAKLSKKVDKRLAAMQLKYARAAGESDNIGVSTDLWPYASHFLIDNHALSDGIIASIPVPDIEPGDKLIWKMRVQGGKQRRITLGVDYEDGSSELVRTSQSGLEKWAEASLQTDTLLKVDRIFASIDFERNDSRVFVDSLQLLHQPFSHEAYSRMGFQRRVAPAARRIVLPPDTSANSSLTPDSITEIPSASTENNLGVRTRGRELKRLP